MKPKPEIGLGFPDSVLLAALLENGADPFSISNSGAPTDMGNRVIAATVK